MKNFRPGISIPLPLHSSVKNQPPPAALKHSQEKGPCSVIAFPKTDFRKMGWATVPFGYDGTLNFTAKRQRGRGTRESIQVSATSAPLPLCGKPNLQRLALPEISFANRYSGSQTHFRLSGCFLIADHGLRRRLAEDSQPYLSWALACLQRGGEAGPPASAERLQAPLTGNPFWKTL